MADNIDDVKINDIVTFQTKAASDNNTYVGVILAMMNFSMAASFADVTAITNQVKLDYDIPDATELNYFVLKNENGEQIIIAKEWIIESTFFRINETGKLTLEIHDVTDDDKATIAGVLASNGYPNIRFK
jgi:hypothetical protein